MNVTRRLLYPRREPRYPLKRRLCGLQGPVWTYLRTRKSTPTGTRTPYRPPCSIVVLSTTRKAVKICIYRLVSSTQSPSFRVMQRNRSIAISFHVWCYSLVWSLASLQKTPPFFSGSPILLFLGSEMLASGRRPSASFVAFPLVL